MSKLPGLFDSFDNLDQIPPEAIASWLKPVPQTISLENYLANRILYPQTFPITERDMQIDLAILREAVKINGPRPGLKKNNTLLGDNPFLNITMRKVLIPVKFLKFIPNLMNLTLIFIDALLLYREKQDYFSDLWTIVLTDDIDRVVGSILLPQFESGGAMNLKLQSKNYEIRAGSLTVIPCPKARCGIAYKLQNGKMLGSKENAIEVYGGELGLVIDGRGS